MIDLIQLMSMQQTATEVSTKLLQEGTETQETQGDIAFMALMAELLVNDPQITSSKNEETLGIHEEKFPLETTSNELEKLSETQELTNDDNSLKESENTDFSDENTPFAWFNTASFEPPNVQVDNAVDLKQLKTDSTNTLVSVPTAAKPDLSAMVDSEANNPDLNTKTETISLSQQLEKASELELTEIIDGKVPAPENKIQKIIISQNDNSVDKNPSKETAYFKMPAEAKVSVEVPGENQSQKLTSTSIEAAGKLTQAANEKTPVNIELNSDENSTVQTNATAIHSPQNNDMKAPGLLEPTHPKMLNLAQNISSPEWGEQFNQQIMWLGQQKIKTAIIKLNPQDLGPLEVNIKLVKDAASVNITTHTPQVRDLIEQTIPRLREMMSEQGVNLSQVNIESNNHQRHSSQASELMLKEQEVDEEQILLTPLSSSKNQGIVDYFA